MSTTFAAVHSQIAKLQAQAEALRKKEMPGVIARIREAIDAYGISAEQLGFGGGKARPGGGSVTVTGGGKSPVGVAMYQDPASGKTWTGRGKPPAWIVGKDRDAFLIANGSAKPATKAARGSRGKAKVGKVGVPKYKDPASDRTWTGRGKPPAWIVGVADRDALLIK